MFERDEPEYLRSLAHPAALLVASVAGKPIGVHLASRILRWPAGAAGQSNGRARLRLGCLRHF
ncbi:MAG: hypothetical protein IPF94_17715 [Betaproteobacteria bacterium]|nr:hypothetical protein [Betaproteobacteria bacterium]